MLAGRFHFYRHFKLSRTYERTYVSLLFPFDGRTVDEEEEEEGKGWAVKWFLTRIDKAHLLLSNKSNKSNKRLDRER